MSLFVAAVGLMGLSFSRLGARASHGTEYIATYRLLWGGDQITWSADLMTWQ